MRATVIETFGGADVLTTVDVPLGEPGPGEVLIALVYAGVNFIDVYMRAGIYRRSETYPTPLPLRLGMEGAGIVEVVGPGVTSVRPGDRVAWCLSRGSYAEHAIVPEWRLVPVPEAIPFDVAAALMLQGSTAHYLTHDAYRLEPGEHCLVHAAAGGVGQLLVQLAKLRGAVVHATVGSEEKAELARTVGADHVILYRQEDFRERVLQETGGKGVAVVYDSVGRDTIHRSIRSLRRRGTCVLFGTSSGVVEAIEPHELAEAGSVYFTRPNLADYTSDAMEVRGRAEMLFDAVQAGRLRVAISRVFPLAEARAAHEVLEGRGSRGKLLLEIGD